MSKISVIGISSLSIVIKWVELRPTILLLIEPFFKVILTSAL